MIQLNTQDPQFKSQLKAATARGAFTAEIEKSAKSILDDVREHGNNAILKYLEKFDHVKLDEPSQLLVDTKEIKKACKLVSQEDKDAIKLAINGVMKFAKEGIPAEWSFKPRNGVLLGEQFAPMQRVAVYIPGGTAPLVSSVIHTAAIAKVAGVKEIVALTPPQADGSVNPYILTALHMIGVKEIYRMGGVYAIGAAAYGTETIEKVEKIVGPGNSWVTAAKKIVYGDVAIDMIAGPSEIMVIADESARPDWVAADLLSQLEHGGGNLAILATHVDGMIEQVEEQLVAQAKTLSREAQLIEGLKEGCILIQTRTAKESATVASMIAPEHLEVQCDKPESLLSYITAAGAIFLGHHTPEPVGDFVAGPSHVLPTAGSAHYFSGLGVESFFRRMSILRYSPRALSREMDAIKRLADMEGLDAHKRSATIRVED